MIKKFKFFSGLVAALVFVMVMVFSLPFATGSSNSNTNNSNGGTSPFTPDTILKNWHEAKK